jgi:hypothetical protein
MPGYTRRALRASGIKRVILLGSTGAISTAQGRALRRDGYSFRRVAGINGSKTSIEIAKHALALNAGFKWKSMGVASKTSCTDALAWAYANGRAGYVYLMTPTSRLDSSVRSVAIAHRADIGRARVYGGSGAISTAARKSLATALRTGK